jgi:hypothetical protein
MKKSKFILFISLLVAFSNLASSARAQVLENASIDVSRLSMSEGVPQSGTADDSVAASDSLHGNGTCTGYALTHAGAIVNSETLHIDGFLKIRNRDYKLDYGTGELTFTEAVKATQTIDVSYRCASDGKSANGTALAFNSGGSSFGGLMYMVNPADSIGGSDLVTYGLNLITKLNANSSMTNMFFNTSSQSGLASSGTSAQKSSDHMFVNQTDLKVHGFDVKVDYQDVGQNFSFTGLRQEGAAPLDQLKQLEKEKGLQRMGFQAGMGGGLATSSLIGFKEVKDSGGSITNEWMNLGDSHFKLAADFQDVSKGFTRFSDLAETNHAQLAKEAGMQRENFTLGFATSKDISADGWNAAKLDNIVDASGKISLGSLNFAGRGFGISAYQTKVDKSFARLSSLSTDDINTMALDIRREFDPNAKAGNATAAETANIQSLTGIDRQNLLGNFSFGKTSIGMQYLTVGDSTGEVSRESLAMKGKDYSVSLFSQKIDSGFLTLSSLSPVEVQNFGNEYGMNRTNLLASFTPKAGLQLNTYFKDVTAGSAGMQRFGLSLNAKNYSVAADFLDMDSNFTRTADLSDSDKTQLASEQGMNRYAVTTHYQVGKVDIGNYIYDGRNASLDTFKEEIKNNVSFNTTSTMRVSLLQDDVNSGSASDPLRSYHELLGVSDRIGGSSVSLNLDNVQNHTPGSADQNINTDTFHLDTDPAKRFIFSTDMKEIGDNLGNSQDNETFRLTSKLSSTLSLTGLRSESTTDKTWSDTDEIGLAGKLTKAFNFSAKFGETLQNNGLSANTNELGFSPSAARDLGSLKNANFTLKLADSCSSGGREDFTVGGKVSWQFLKQSMAFEYNGLNATSAVVATAHGFEVAGDPNPKNALHYSFSYKTANTSTLGVHDVIRHYSVDWQVNKGTKLAYNLSDNGRLLATSTPVTESLKMSTVMSKQLSLIGQYDYNVNRQTGNLNEGTSVGFSGKIDATSNVDVTVGVDHRTDTGNSWTSVDLRLKYDLQLNKDNFLTASGAITNWSGYHSADYSVDNMLFQFGYRTLFH